LLGLLFSYISIVGWCGKSKIIDT